jgi:hypothetical protein
MNNIKISQIDTSTLISQTYKNDDLNLVESFEIKSIFNPLDINYHIENHIYDINNNLLKSNYRLSNFSIENPYSLNSIDNISLITLDPINNIINDGFDEGIYNSYYGFYKNHLGSSFDKRFYIKEISSNRTELKLSSNNINLNLVKEKLPFFIEILDKKEYYGDFLLNFGNNQNIIAVNILLDNNDILIKLYEPLPLTFDLKSTFWIVEKISEPILYNIEFPNNIILIDDTIKIKGPNFNIPINDIINNSSEYIDFESIILNNITSSYNQLNSIFEEKGIKINIDYNNYSNFIHFSSAERRLSNFFYKIIELENIDNNLELLNNINSSSLNQNNILLENKKKENIITNFDGYEYFLYYETGSNNYPKQSSNVLYNTTSSFVQNWITSSLENSIKYDELNQNILSNSIPEYIRNNNNNFSYTLYIDMIAHHFDNIWVYINDITKKYNTDNRIDFGVSKDLVSQILKDFGLKIYQNNFSENDLATAFLGISGSFPNSSDILPISINGTEYINNFVSLSDNIPFDDINKRLYKRLYHNLPLIFKQKGTINGLRSLISSYGIPNTILDVKEFGFKSLNDINEYKKEIFNYSFHTEGSGFINIPFEDPNSILFRFKLNSIQSGSLPNLNQNILNIDNNFLLSVQYTGSGLFSTNTYSGSIPDIDFMYGNIIFKDLILSTSCSVYVPIYNNEWWSLNIEKKQSGSNYIYNLKIGNNQNLISSSFSSLNSWSGSNNLYLGYSGSLHNYVSASFQEFRYYNNINNNIIKEYIYNPYSILEPNEITFRASLGSVLDINNTSSIHPYITGSIIPIQSFLSGNSNFSYGGNYVFKPNYEKIYINEPTIGLKNTITERIKIETFQSSSFPEINIPSNNILSPYIKKDQNNINYTNPNEYLEIGFSPQNDINNDISSQLGVFDLATYIGDPSILYIKDKKYPQLELLKKEYLNKYLSNFGLYDYIRLIKYFDNSLFKILKDFIPAKSDSATGVIIKSSILDRNKITTSIPIVSEESVNFSIKNDEIIIEGEKIIISDNNNPIYNFSGDNALLLNNSQSWDLNIKTIKGDTIKVINNSQEFFTGEYSGSNLLVTDGELNDCNTQLKLIYNSSSLGNTIGSTLTPGPQLLIPYTLDNTKIYYINFSFNNLQLEDTLSLIDNSSKNIFNIPYLSGPDPSISGSKENILISNFNSPIGFSSNISPVNITDVEIYELDIDRNCLVLENNINQNRNSTNKQLINYINQIESTNFEQLLSGSSAKYEIQDSNYNLSRHINPRYLGSKNLITNIKFPPREEYIDYFAYFDWIGGADPQVPGGGNIHIIFLVDKEGNKISLNEKNKNLFLVENIFKTGNKIDLYPISDGNINTKAIESDIIFGGGLLNTILFTRDSSISHPQLGLSTSQASSGYAPSASFRSSTVLDNIIRDYKLGENFSGGYLWNLNIFSSSLAEVAAYYTYEQNDQYGISIYDTKLNQTGSFMTPPSNTFLPLQKGDFIRFGESNINTNFSQNEFFLDKGFNEPSLFTILDISYVSDTPTIGPDPGLFPSNGGSLTLHPPLSNYKYTSGSNSPFSNRQTQRMRIMRKIPNETFILIKHRPFSSKGFVIPENYNPNLKWEDLATKAGLL